jgi:DinB superfamily
MQMSWAIEQLEAQAGAILALASGVPAEDAHLRPAPGQWSLLEVLAHLLDEEREDFRQRLDLTLHHPEAEWPPIDPEGWVTARAYQERDLGETIAAWREERRRSLDWLRSLAAPDLTVVRRHPAGFELRAGDLLGAWVAHDLLHLRQLVELRYNITAQRAAPFSVEYAGDW